MSRFLPPKTQAHVIKYKSIVFRYLRFLGLKPSNWKNFFTLTCKEPGTFQLKNIPQSQYKIACILDEFSFESFQPEANFLQLDINNWKAQIESFQPDIILIESAWRGKNAGWNRKVSEISNEIIELAKWADDHNVPTVFWHKEVPPHLKTFMHVSRLFDYIFLTDADCIKTYRKKVGHPHVYFSPFSAQPKMHHPIQEQDRKRSVIYAGTFYPEFKYPDRYRNFIDIYDSLSPLIDFDIYDRMAGKGNYTFPEKFHKHIRGSLPFSQMSMAYRKYEYGLNMNSVKNSSTMCSRRVFELIACNTLVIGNYSRAVQSIFGNLTICSDDQNEILQRFQRLESDAHYKNSIRLHALRKVMNEYTYEQCLQKMVSTISSGSTKHVKQILVVAACSTQEQYNSIVQNFNRQKYVDRQLMIVSENQNIQINPGVLFSSVKNFANTWRGIQSQFVAVAVFDANWFYGSFYLTDLMHGLKYGTTDIVTKPLTADQAYKSSNACLPYHSIFRSNRFDPNHLNETIHNSCISIDAFNLHQGSELTKEQIAKVEGQL